MKTERKGDTLWKTAKFWSCTGAGTNRHRRDPGFLRPAAADPCQPHSEQPGGFGGNRQRHISSRLADHPTGAAKGFPCLSAKNLPESGLRPAGLEPGGQAESEADRSDRGVGAVHPGSPAGRDSGQAFPERNVGTLSAAASQGKSGDFPAPVSLRGFRWEIAQRYAFSESKVKMQLHRTREKLRRFLEQEGIAL